MNCLEIGWLMHMLEPLLHAWNIARGSHHHKALAIKNNLSNIRDDVAACSNIKEICLELDKELNTVLEKNYRIKENIRENIKEKNFGSTSSYFRDNKK